jgi:type VI secretion system secreted protein Hcp
MAFDTFLKIDSIPGESTDAKHKDWIEIQSYSHGAQQTASRTVSTAGGATAERVDVGDFHVNKLVDKSTPKLFEACCTGAHIKEVILEVCRAGGDKQKFIEIKMEHVLITNYKHSGDGESFPSERFSLNPGKIKITYSQQKRSDGVLGGNVAAGWDLIANKTIA